MKMVFRMHGRSSQRRRRAGGHEFKLVEAKMKTAAEPLVKTKPNHLQAKPGQAGTQLQNATATVEAQEEFLATSLQILDSTKKVETADATAERSDDKVSRRNRRCERRSSKTAHCG